MILNVQSFIGDSLIVKHQELNLNEVRHIKLALTVFFFKTKTVIISPFLCALRMIQVKIMRRNQKNCKFEPLLQSVRIKAIVLLELDLKTQTIIRIIIHIYHWEFLKFNEFIYLTSDLSFPSLPPSHSIPQPPFYLSPLNPLLLCFCSARAHFPWVPAKHGL